MRARRAARLAEQRQVDREGECAEPGIGADVRGRLLAADVLLARREREHEAALAFGIDRLADERPGICRARYFCRLAKEPDIRPAERQRIADRLAFAHDDVGAHLAGRRDEAERHDLGDDGDQQRADGVRLLGDRPSNRAGAEHVGRSAPPRRRRLVVDRREDILGALRRRRQRDDLIDPTCRDTVSTVSR
jgi:hypothetical protein